MYGVIYKVTNIINGKIYIGQTTKTVKLRRAYHLSARHTKKYYFYNALNKHGYENFIWEEIDTAETRDEIDQKEKYWQKTFRRI